MSATQVSIYVDTDYKYVLAASISIALLSFITPFIISLRVRIKVFNKEFMEQNFAEIHEKEVGGRLPRFGFPD